MSRSMLPTTRRVGTDSATGAHTDSDPPVHSPPRISTPSPTRVAWEPASDEDDLKFHGNSAIAAMTRDCPARKSGSESGDRRRRSSSSGERRRRPARKSGAESGERRRRSSITRIAARWMIDELAAAELALNFERAQSGGTGPTAPPPLSPIRPKMRMPWSRGWSRGRR